MARKSIRMIVVDNPDGSATILKGTEVPSLTGDDPINMLCGKCSAMLCQGVSPESIAKRFGAPAQLLLECPKCQCHNRLPAITAN